MTAPRPGDAGCEIVGPLSTKDCTVSYVISFEFCVLIYKHNYKYIN